jgi:hypothetical protein
MKNCLICGHAAQAESPTCPACGEGSFAPVVAVEPPQPLKAPEAPALADAATDEATLIDSPSERTKPRGR